MWIWTCIARQKRWWRMKTCSLTRSLQFRQNPPDHVAQVAAGGFQLFEGGPVDGYLGGSGREIGSRPNKPDRLGHVRTFCYPVKRCPAVVPLQRGVLLGSDAGLFQSLAVGHWQGKPDQDVLDVGTDTGELFKNAVVLGVTG